MTLKDLEINNTIIDLEVNNNHQRIICKVIKNKLLKDNFENNEIIYTVNYILIDYNKNLIFTDNINYELKYFTEDNKNVHISIMDDILDFLYYFIEDTGKYNNLDVKEILEQYKNMNVNKFYESYK